MKYPPGIIEQIKLRVPLLEEVRKVVPKVQKKGKYWWANCPFHGEKSPSFHVREDQGSYYCFGCGAGGDVLKFVQETQGGSFTEVVERLAQQAGIKLPAREASNPERQALWEQGQQALARAKVFYQRSLNELAKEYLHKRQLSNATVAEFGLGYSPESYSATHEALLTEGFKPEVLREVGLALASEQGKADYDRFRGRLMFPIENLKGEVVGFGGRVLGKTKDERGPKYLNSPETPWFNKGSLLYNLHRAKPHFKAGIPLLVEGYMDVIALWQAGIKTAVAPLGTAVGTEQLALLWQQHPSPLVCLDGDAAGRSAAIRAALRALPVLEPGKTLNFVFLPDGEDPDSLVQKDGVGAFRTLLANPKPLEQVLWEHLSGGLDLQSADGRALAEAKLTETLLELKHPVVKQAYRANLREKIYQASRSGPPKKAGKLGAFSAPPAQAPVQLRGNPAEDLGAAYLVALVCRWPQILPNVDEMLAELSLPPGPLAELVQALLRAYVQGQTLDEDFAQSLQEGPFGGVVAALLRDSGVAALPATPDAAAAFREAYARRRTQQSQREEHKDLLKNTNFLDPDAWVNFSRRRRGPTS